MERYLTETRKPEMLQDNRFMSNGACYIRVSTDDQMEYSPDAQLKALKEYAKNNNILLTKEYVYVDEGISGRRAEKRPAFMKMVSTAKLNPKPFDVILVHKFDRFARSREDSVVYKSLLKKECGIKVVSITESIEDDKFSIILEAMLEAMAEYYSLNLSEEVKKGMTEKAERGEVQTTPSFGYKMINKRLKTDPEEAKIIKLIFNKFAFENEKMYSIAQYVNSLGIKTKRGNSFESRTIDYILNNPVYIGKARWTPTGKVKRNFNHPDTIIKDSSHEAIIDIETWEKAQERTKQNKEIYRRREKTTTTKKTWLSGLVRCSDCNSTLVTNGVKYMQCNAYLKGACKTTCHIKISLIEELVLEELKKTYTGKIKIHIVPKGNGSTFKDEQDFLNDRLEKLDYRELRIKLAFQDGIDTLEEYRGNRERIESERKIILNELNLLKKKLKVSAMKRMALKTESKQYITCLQMIQSALKLNIKWHIF